MALESGEIFLEVGAEFVVLTVVTRMILATLTLPPQPELETFIFP